MPSFVVSRDGNIASVVLNRPPVNALTKDCYLELDQIFRDFKADEGLGCVVLSASGSGAFCAGLDLKEFTATTTIEADLACTRAAHASFLAIMECPVPVIAAVQGPAIGAGCVIAAMCDIRLASPRATFGLPEVKVDRVGGGTALGRVLPSGLMRQMVFTGEPINADVALAHGLVQAIFPEEELRGRAGALAHKIGQNGRNALRLSKKSIFHIYGQPLAEAFALEAECNMILFQRERKKDISHHPTPIPDCL